MTLQIYDTMERQKVPFVPRTEGEVAMYVCGPTVYDVPHLGHGRTALTYDMIRRYLEWCDYNVTVASNVTDIDDKIIARAEDEAALAAELAALVRADAVPPARPSIMCRSCHVAHNLVTDQELRLRRAALQAALPAPGRLWCLCCWRHRSAPAAARRPRAS